MSIFILNIFHHIVLICHLSVLLHLMLLSFIYRVLEELALSLGLGGDGDDLMDVRIYIDIL